MNNCCVYIKMKSDAAKSKFVLNEPMETPIQATDKFVVAALWLLTKGTNNYAFCTKEHN